MLFKKILFWILTIVFSFNINSGDTFSVFKDLINETNLVFEDIIHYNNADVVGRLKINSIELDVPVLQYADNSYYLKHDEFGSENSDGSIFLDYRNSIEDDRKLLIFGHNSRNNDTEFNKLEKFTDSSFFNNDNNRTVTLITTNKKIEYFITSVLIVDSTSKHMQLLFTDDEWKEHIDWINDNSIYNDKLSYNNDILILQTCYYNPEGSYLLIVAKSLGLIENN